MIGVYRYYGDVMARQIVKMDRMNLLTVVSLDLYVDMIFQWYGMEAFLFTEGIQLTATHSGGRYSDLTQEEVQHLWRYNLYSQG